VRITERLVGERARYDSEGSDDDESSEEDEEEDAALREEELHVRAEALVISKKRISEEVSGHMRSGRFYSYDRDHCTFVIKWQSGVKEVVARAQILSEC
jgi:hypothetical protein